MIYRFLGNTGLQVSVLSWGNWVNTKDYENIKNSVDYCYKNGINFFDTAEIYGFGQGESQLGQALAELNIPREKLVISTKIYKVGTDVNDGMLSRKHIIEGTKNSLKRLQLSYVDLLFCHRFDHKTDVEEVCRSMNWVIDQGLAFFWGTSEWEAVQIAEAIGICDRLGLRRPVVEQCQYNLLERRKMEDEYGYLFDKYNYGTTTWSPLSSGLLTGKYLGDTEAAGRLNNGDVKMIKERYLKKKESVDEKITGLIQIAKELDTTASKLAIAWVVKNPNTTTCILGSSKISQLEENIGALELLTKLTPEVEAKIEAVFNNAPEPKIDYRTYTPFPQRRQTLLAKLN